jgi:hypothetical protein
VKIRGGPAAVTGDETCKTTVRLQPNGKGTWRETREPEDERSDEGNRW